MAKTKAKEKETGTDLNKLVVPVSGPGQKLFVPACGDRLILTAPWEFPLYLEYRNMQFAVEVGLYSPSATDKWGAYEPAVVGQRSRYKKVQAVLPAGTMIECDRVYIRTFNKSAIKDENDFDSITWKIVVGGKAKQKLRFWTKLVNCLSIQYELQFDSTYRDRIKAIKDVHES